MTEIISVATSINGFSYDDLNSKVDQAIKHREKSNTASVVYLNMTDIERFNAANMCTLIELRDHLAEHQLSLKLVDCNEIVKHFLITSPLDGIRTLLTD